MFKKRCKNCNERIDKKFSFCPYCGIQLRGKAKKEGYGMLGETDEIENQIKMPFGLQGMMNSLIKQLEKQMGSVDPNMTRAQPKGFKIQITTGKPTMNNVQQMKNINEEPLITTETSKKESQRRSKLPKVEATSNFRRLPEALVYEVSAPGVKSKEQVTITKLEESIEVKAYSKDKCYIKTIPLKLEILGWTVKNEKVLLKLKG